MIIPCRTCAAHEYISIVFIRCNTTFKNLMSVPPRRAGRRNWPGCLSLSRWAFFPDFFPLSSAYFSSSCVRILFFLFFSLSRTISLLFLRGDFPLTFVSRNPFSVPFLFDFVVFVVFLFLFFSFIFCPPLFLVSILFCITISFRLLISNFFPSFCFPSEWCVHLI